MKMNKILFIILFSALQISAQTITGKEEELNNLREEINKIEAEIKTSASQQKDALQLLEKYNRQNFLLNKLIVQLRIAQNEKQKNIGLLGGEIKILNEKSESLKRVYSKYVVLVYKQMGKNELYHVANSKSYEQAILRLKYLKEFSEKGKELTTEIKMIVENLSDKKEKLNIVKREEAQLLNEKEIEEKKIIGQISLKRKLIDKLKKDQTALKKELDTKKKYEKKIRQIIADLIAKEEEKKKQLEQKFKTENPKIETTEVENFDQTFKDFSSFSVQKGRLSWPIKKGRVIRKFGENKNQKLKTVTLNYGIDIKVDGDMTVRNVADGIVSIIEWIPGYGTVVIVTHKGGYRTVLGHIKNINVATGDVVKIGAKIGEVSESLEGNIVHFEIWHERNYQNPEVWLARR